MLHSTNAKLILLTLIFSIAAIDCEKRPKLNLLLITIDTLRADHLGCYRYKKNTSPNIDQIAKQGVMFLNTMAQRGQTWPSITSIMTSLYPQTHGVRENGDQLDASKITLAEILKKKGYSTGAVLTNMQSAPNRGFDSISKIGKYARVRDNSADTKATDRGIDWLRTHQNIPFFLWVHYIAPHRPYSPPPPYDERFAKRGDVALQDKALNSVMLFKTELSDQDLAQIIGLYDGEIAYVDNEVGRLVKEFEKLGLAKNSLVVITADHGEELYDRNFHFGHGCSIYDAVLRVPLVMRLTGTLPENRQIKSVVQSIDIVPTVLKLLSIQKSYGFEGKNLTNLIFSKKESTESSIAYSEIRDKVASVRTDNWRYIYNPEAFQPSMIFSHRPKDYRRNRYFIDEEEMYFLPHDPHEQSNVIQQNQKVASELKTALSTWRKKSTTVYHPKEINEETREELRGLGYIQ